MTEIQASLVIIIGIGSGEITFALLLPNKLVITISALNLKYITTSNYYTLLHILNTGRPGPNSLISDQHLALIAKDYLNDWKDLRPYLELSYNQQTAIAKSDPGDYARQRHECLEEWRKTKGTGATYHALILAAEKAKQQLLADRVRNLIDS